MAALSISVLGPGVEAGGHRGSRRPWLPVRCELMAVWVGQSELEGLTQ